MCWSILAQVPLWDTTPYHIIIKEIEKNIDIKFENINTKYIILFSILYYCNKLIQ